MIVCQKQLFLNGAFAKDMLKSDVINNQQPHVFLWQVRAPITEEEMAQIKGYGVTTIQSFRLLDNTEDVIQDYLDLALKYELNVIVYLQRFVERLNDNTGCHLNKKGRMMIEKYHQHNAIYAWHTLDEPAQHDWTRQCQQDLHDYVKSVDSTAKVMISTNIFTQEHYDQYFQPTAMDIMDLHKYSNPNANWKQIQMLELYEKNSPEKDIELIITLRAFNAPHKALRLDMSETSLIENYQKIFLDNGMTNNVGFYGWDLSTNVGIKRSEFIREQFLAVLNEHFNRHGDR